MTAQTEVQDSTEIIKIRLIKAELQVGLRFARIAASHDYKHEPRMQALGEAQRTYAGVLCDLKRLAIPSLEDELWISQRLEELRKKLEAAGLGECR